MNFLVMLRNGQVGVRFAFPASFEVEEESPQGATLWDEGRQVTWGVSFSGAMLDIRPGYEGLLRADLEHATRDVFQARYEASAAGPQREPRRPPRTADPAWSPLISVDRIRLAGAAALQVIYRLAYEPGDEIVVGALLIPVSRGTVQVSVTRRVALTGLREAVLVDRGLVGGGDNAPEGGAAPSTPIPQAQIDDPQYDALLPEHPLSVVRSALRWLLERADTQLVVTAPLGEVPAGEVPLKQLGCAITPPPRYLFAPTLAERMSDSMAPFTRATLPGSGLRLLDIWRVPDVKITGLARRWRLKRLATSTTRQWKREGMTDIRIRVRDLAPQNGRTRLETYSGFRSFSGPTKSLAHWLVDHDGSVFRFSVSGPASFKKRELLRDVEQAASSWRRLDVKR